MIVVDPPPPPTPTPVTVECVVAVSQRYGVPLEVLAGILAQERGQVGHANGNKDGSRDHGPMQVNDFWAPTLERYGIRLEDLRYNGCWNVAVGAWILRYEQARVGGDLWAAVGRYHAPNNPARAASYRQRIRLRVRDLLRTPGSLDKLLAEVNGEQTRRR